MDELTVSTAAQNGDIFVTETNGLSNLSLSAGTGNVTLTLNDGSVVDTDGSEDISAKSANVTVSNGRFGTGSNSITTNVDVLLVDTTGANGDQFIKEVSGLTGLNLNAKNGNITLEVGGAVTDDETDADITANVATITANGDFGGANAINTAVSTLSVSTGPSAGNINVKEADDVTLSKLSTANGSISLRPMATSPFLTVATVSWQVGSAALRCWPMAQTHRLQPIKRSRPAVVKSASQAQRM